MFQILTCGDVTYIRMGRPIFGRTIRLTNAFLLDGLAVESGCAYFKRQMHRFYRENMPRQAVFTHKHEDHAGNVRLLNDLGIIPYVHKDALDVLASGPVIPYYRRFVWGTPTSGQCQAVGDTIETDRYRFRVIPAPGHCDDHLCLYEEKQGWLFTGDLYVGEKIYYLYDQENLPLMKKTLKQLSALEFSTIFCSHRGPLQKGPEALTGKLTHIETLEEKAKTLQAKGLPLKDITRQLLGKEDLMNLISGGEFSKTAFVRALLNWDKPR